MAIFNSYVSLPEGRWFSEGNHGVSDSFCIFCKFPIQVMFDKMTSTEE